MSGVSQLTIAERERMVLLGTRAGRSAAELAAELDVYERTVVRIRRRLREMGMLA